MSAILQTYNRKKISFKRGKGSYLYSNNGKKYLDFVQGIAVNSLGHSHPHLIKAINLSIPLLMYGKFCSDWGKRSQTVR